jgi:hypothetical protein
VEPANRLSTALIAIGFAVGLGAWLFAAFGGNRASATSIFAAGFIAATIGICTRIVGMPKTDDQGRSTFGLRLGAVGFAIAALPVAVGAFFLGMSEESLEPIFYVGVAIILVGIAISWIAVIRGKR